MRLKIERQPSSDKCTIGQLFVNGIYECWTLEDPVREVKIPGKTAIPAGIYQVIVDYSNRFKRQMPHIAIRFPKTGIFSESITPVKEVPNFQGIRIHSGNTSEDTEGCILLGMNRGPKDDWIGQSNIAFGGFWTKLWTALSAGEMVMIEITNG